MWLIMGVGKGQGKSIPENSTCRFKDDGLPVAFSKPSETVYGRW